MVLDFNARTIFQFRNRFIFYICNNSVSIINYIKIKREMRNMELVKIKLKKDCCSGEICVKILEQVNFSVEEGKFVAVAGLLDCGKKTLLNVLSEIR